MILEKIDRSINKGAPTLSTDRVFRIFFLEDNPDDVELMQHELNEEGLQFISIRSDKKNNFLEEVNSFQPDVILADYSLASFNGVQAFNMLKKEKIMIPFILVTGVLSEQLALECLKDGIDDFVLKSSFKRLPTAIKNAIKKKEAEQEKNRIAHELKKSHGELRLLLNRQQISVEEERMNIARDLHDELGQELTALKIDIAIMQKKLVARTDITEQAINDGFNLIMQMVDQITKSVKEISSGLRPETLDDLGIVEAIRFQAIEFEKRNRIVCKCYFPKKDLILNKTVSIAIFRIVQEALTNVSRHSDATFVELHLDSKDNELFLEIKDNGRGIEEEQVSSSKSLGLIGMRERVLQLNGEFKIKNSTSGGTTVTAKIPYLNQKGDSL